MKKKIILLLLFVLAAFSGWAQYSISITTPVTGGEIGTTIPVNFQYSAPAPCNIYAGIGLQNADWSPVSFLAGNGASGNPLPAGENLTGTIYITIPSGTTPTASLTGGQNYKINIVINNASWIWQAGHYPETELNFTAPTVALPAISFTSVPTSTQVGTNLVVNYKYTAPSAGGKVAVVVTKNGGTNPWDYISTVIYDELTPNVAGTDVTGTFTLAIPGETTPTASLTGNENYRMKIELLDSGNNFLAGNYDYTNYNFTAAPVTPAVSFTSVPTSTQVGTNLVVNYKYTAPAAGGKVAVVVTKNGGTNSWDYISTVIYDELTPNVAGTDVTGTFTLAIPGETTPTASLTGNDNYRMKIELLDSGNNFLAGNYDYLNYNFTAAPVTPAISFTSVPTSTQVGTNLVVNYKYTAPAAGGKVAVVVTKNGGTNSWDYISTVIYDELTPTVAGTDVTGTFTLAIPGETTPTASLTGNENYRMKIELLDSGNNFLAGNYDYLNYNFTAAPVTPAISFTSVPTSTQVGTNLVVNYKYTAPAAGGKVAIVVTKNGGTNPWDYISTVIYDELTPNVAGTDVTGTFTLAIPGETTPTASLTGNENYRMKIELLDSGNNWLAGNYDYTNYNFTAATYNYYVDADGDNYGAGKIVALTSPTAPSGYSINNTDCDDTNATVYPDATEIYDSIDNDCDGSVDEGATLPSTLTFCKGSATVAIAKGTTDLQLYTSLTATALSGATVLTSKVYYATLNGSARTAVTITVNDLPSTPGTISTTDAVLCKYIGTSNIVTYSVPAVAATTYNWTVPAGVNVIPDASATDNSITVNFLGSALNNTSVGGVGTISVRSVNSLGCISAAPKSLVLTSKLPSAPASLTLTSADTTPHFNQAVVPATSPATFNFVGLNALTKITKVGPYMGTSTIFTLTAPPALTAASYAWTLPSGVTQLSGGTSNVITVNFAGVASGIGALPIVVKSVGGCGQSVARTLALARAIPAAPTKLVLTDGTSATAITKIGAYTGKSTELTLTATPVLVQGATATSYAWVLPAGVVCTSAHTTGITLTGSTTIEGVPTPWTIENAIATTTGSITINFSGVASGVFSFPLSVYGVNGVGNSKARTLTVTAAAPATPSISASPATTFTSCSTRTYTATSATTGITAYNWTIPAGASFDGASNGNVIVVNYATTSVAIGASSVVTCSATNGTGTSAIKSLTVKRVDCPAKVSGTSNDDNFSVNAYPNPSSDVFNIETSGKGATAVEVYDMQGRLVENSKANTNTVQVGARLSSGAYNVIVKQGANTKTLRVIKR